MRITRTTTGLAATTMLVLSLAACGGDSEEASAAPSGDVGSVDLAAAGCPETIVVQTDWNPESEHGGTYQLLGDDYEIDAENKSVSGTLVDSSNESTGVTVEIRAGGPAIGFQTVTSQLYSDDSITLGYVDTDEAVQLSADQPTTAVVTPLEKSPIMIMWDPEKLSDVSEIADLGTKGTVVRYFEGDTYMQYLLSEGILEQEQLDASYDGTPASFVASAGDAAQQGFASAEPYIYENEVDAWGKPVDYQLVYDTGYQPYQSSIAVRSDELEGMSGCLTELVPLMQQAEVDYIGDAAGTNDVITELVEEYDTGWVYSTGVAEYSVETQKAEGIVGNGANGTLGDFDLDRVQSLIEQVTPIFAEQGTPVAEGVTPESVVTNEFIDPSISLG